MHHFHYAGTGLHCESVDLLEVARLYGTPTYVYSAATMADNALDRRGMRHLGLVLGLDARLHGNRHSLDAMGGGQATRRDFSSSVNFGASDPRKDGAAIPEAPKRQ